MKMRMENGQRNARASPVCDAQRDRRGAVESGQRLPYQERMPLKKLAQQRRKEDDRKRKMKIATLNVGTVNGRGRGVVDVMQRKKVEILCVQETRWNGQTAKELGEGYKIYCSGEGIVVSTEMKEGVLQVILNSSRSMTVKLEVGKIIVNVLCAYAPQVGCDEEEEEEFWNDLGHIVAGIPN